MKTFDGVWKLATKDTEVSPPLKSLVRESYDEVTRRPTDRRALKDKLEALFRYLASPSGLTIANCRATDLFFCFSEDLGGWGHLPQEFRLIVDDIAMTLHDSVAAPDIAKNFESHPEQLLDRLLKIKIEGAV